MPRNRKVQSHYHAIVWMVSPKPIRSTCIRTRIKYFDKEFASTQHVWTMRCRYSDTALRGRFQVYGVPKLNVVGCQQLAAHVLVLRPSTIITISELQNFVEIITLSISVSVAATVVAQTILAIPIIIALVHRASERAWARYGDELITDGATRFQAVPQILMIVRADLVTAILAGFGRTVSEVGAVILVGGNIRGLTRTMTTTIALQTSQGDLSLALALGAVLIGISISISATVFALAGQART